MIWRDICPLFGTIKEQKRKRYLLTSNLFPSIANHKQLQSRFSFGSLKQVCKTCELTILLSTRNSLVFSYKTVLFQQGKKSFVLHCFTYVESCIRRSSNLCVPGYKCMPFKRKILTYLYFHITLFSANILRENIQDFFTLECSKAILSTLQIPPKFRNRITPVSYRTKT